MQSKIPLGYKIVDGIAVIDTKQKDTVLLIYERYLACKSLLSIAKELKESSRPNANGNINWTHGGVARILENKKYIGDSFYPQLINTEIFQKVQELRSQNKKVVTKKQSISVPTSYPKKPKTIYLPPEIKKLDISIQSTLNKELIFKRAEMLYKQSKIYDIGGI